MIALMEVKIGLVDEIVIEPYKKNYQLLLIELEFRPL